jgi:hypothetical protein
MFLQRRSERALPFSVWIVHGRVPMPR